MIGFIKKLLSRNDIQKSGIVLSRREYDPATGKYSIIPDAVRKKDQIDYLSTAIHNYEYDPKTKKLLVRFTSNPNKAYEFINVSQKRKDALDNAPSKGRFVNQVLKLYNTWN